MSQACPLRLALLFLIAASAGAHTIVIDANEADRMAAISDAAPRMSWAAGEEWPAIYSSANLELVLGRAFLFRFALDKIPAGQRITFAELILPVQQFSGVEPRFYLWRVLPEWGPGVSHRYRIAAPAKKEWAAPGARGLASDRALRPSAVVRVLAAGEQVINVTGDLELWHAGAAPNRGWLLTVEDPGVALRFPSPAWDAPAAWKLRITYEPE